MKKGRDELEKILDNICMNVALNTDLCNNIYDFVKEKYNIPKSVTSDLICFRMSMSEVSEFVLFCLLDAIIEIVNQNGSLSDFYTEQEINKYSKSKYKIDKIKFPLRFKMIQVTNDQWIGSTTLHELLKFRAAQLINYNANTQRMLTKIINGNKEIFKITINKTAVNEIKNSCENRTFIPNTITLNIPTDKESDFYYDNDKCELVINKLESFDNIDGFHRLIALYKASDKDNKFDYNMELRIVNWDDSRCQTFIYQEDKRTPIKKIDAKSMNMNDMANIVVERLNNNINFNLKGLISRNDGIINFGELAELIRYLYFKNKTKQENENMFIISLVKYLCECFNALTEYDFKYLNEKYSFKQLSIVMYGFYIYQDKDRKYMCKIIDNAVFMQDNLTDKKFQSRVPRLAMINEIKKLYEVVNNV